MPVFNCKPLQIIHFNSLPFKDLFFIVVIWTNTFILGCKSFFVFPDINYTTKVSLMSATFVMFFDNTTLESL